MRSSEPRANPFWSSIAAGEFALRSNRPLALPETPDADLPPVPHDGDLEGTMETPGEATGQRSGTGEKVLQWRHGRRSADGGSSGAFRTPNSWRRREDGIWQQSEGEMPSEEASADVKTEGPVDKLGLDEEEQQRSGSSLEDALGREVVEHLLKQNQALLRELEEIKARSGGGSSSWSEVSQGAPQTPTRMKNEEKVRNEGGGGRVEAGGVGKTPGGTQIPQGTPPMDDDGWIPPPPPPVPEFPDFSKYELEHYPTRGPSMMLGTWQWVPASERMPKPPTWPSPADDIREAAEEINRRASFVEQELGGGDLSLRGRAQHLLGDLPPEGRAQQLLGALPPEARAKQLRGDLPLEARAQHWTGDLSLRGRAQHLFDEGAHQGRAQHLGALNECQDSRAWHGYGDPALRDRALATTVDGDLHDSRGLWQGLHDEGAAGQGQFEGGTKQLHHHGFGESQGGGTRVDLPPLPTSLTPMDLGDWLTLIGPILRDITPQSAVWWELTMKQAHKFYEEWRTSSPVQRVKINPVLPAELLKPIFARTEQRGVGLLLKAVSEDLRGILISNRDMNSTSLVWRLLITFQPGGSGEKGQLLEDLTVLKPANTAESVVVALRHWRRCFQRAQEIGASLPDGTLLLKGLEVTAKVLASLDTQTAFRIAQSRSELEVDTALNAPVLWQFSQVLLAEAETLQLTVATSSLKTTTSSSGPQAKLLQGAGTNPKQLPANGVCKFWGTTDGCRDGKQCKYPHPDLADKKDRCWVCSATTHRRSECPVAAASTSSKPDGGSGAGGQGQGGKGGSKGKTKADSGGKPAVKSTKSGGSSGGGGTNQPSEVNQETTNGNTGATSTTTETPSTTTVKAEETPPATGETSLVSEVTSLLRSLRAEASVKVCGIRRLQPSDQVSVLLDGGATHCLRTCENDREWRASSDIEVSLAEGSKVMKQCPITKTLLTKERVQPIIPVSMVTSLGYQVIWQENHCRISHPSRADLPVQLVQGCPTVGYDVGMKLFREVEEAQKEQCWIKAVLTGQQDAGQDKRLEDLRRLFPEVPVRLMTRLPGKKE